MLFNTITEQTLIILISHGTEQGGQRELRKCYFFLSIIKL